MYRGAPFGAAEVERKIGAPCKVRLHKVRVNSQGYDRAGNYWGRGEQLWEAREEDGWDFHLRAPTRDAAKAKVVSRWPGAGFYR